jgi:hypothetical protein
MSVKSHAFAERLNRHLREESLESKTVQAATPEDQGVEQNEGAGGEPEGKR